MHIPSHFEELAPIKAALIAVLDLAE